MTDEWHNTHHGLYDNGELWGIRTDEWDNATPLVQQSHAVAMS